MPSGTGERKRYARGMRSTGVVRSGDVKARFGAWKAQLGVRAVACSIAGALALAACSRAEPHEPPRPDPDAVRAASRTPRPPETTTPPAPRALPGPFARLGEPCAADEAAPADDASKKRPPPSRRPPSFASEECGDGGKVVKVTVPGFHADALPGPLVHREGPPQMMAHALGVEEGRVWAQSSCMACRMMTDSTTVVDVAAASDATLETFQAYVGLPKAPLLRTAAAWREAIPTWAKGAVAQAKPAS